MLATKKIADLEQKVQGLQEKYDQLISRLDSGYDFARWMAQDQAAMRLREGEHLVDRQNLGAYGGSLDQASS